MPNVNLACNYKLAIKYINRNVGVVTHHRLVFKTSSTH